MLTNDYINAALRTECPYDKFDAATADPRVVRDLFFSLGAAALHARRMDVWKRFLYYGKRPEASIVELAGGPEARPEQIARLQDETTRRLLHGVIGLVTEAGELVEAIMNHVIDGKPLDLVNIGEEVGDSFWYEALILTVTNSDPSVVARHNIEKLLLRFPDKFTEENALVRDIVAERRALEGKTIQEEVGGDDPAQVLDTKLDLAEPML